MGGGDTRRVFPKMGAIDAFGGQDDERRDTLGKKSLDIAGRLLYGNARNETTAAQVPLVEYRIEPMRQEMRGA